jgi:predicted PurR-regulated permease PerM
VFPLAASAGEQAASLATRLPAALQNDPLAHIPLPAWLEDFRPRLADALRSQLANLDQTIGPTLREIGSGLLSGLGNVLAAVLIPILSFFFVKDGPLIRSTLLSTVKPSQRLVLMEILDDLNRLLAQYIRSLVMLAILVFAVYSLFFAAAGVPYSLFLATVAALLEFIPVAGPLVASLSILIVSALTGYPHMLLLFIFLIVFRLLQDYLINPYLMSSGVAIHPLLVLFGVLAGEQIAGLPGMFFSVPVMAALRIIVLRVREEARA